MARRSKRQSKNKKSNGAVLGFEEKLWQAGQYTVNTTYHSILISFFQKAGRFLGPQKGCYRIKCKIREICILTKFFI